MKYLLIALIFLSTPALAEIEYTHFMVHHTDTPSKWGTFDKEKCDELATARGWTECGYNFMIERDGTVYTGRALGKQGAHCPTNGMNRNAIAVALVLKGEIEQPTEYQVEALKSVYRQYSRAFDGLELTMHKEHRATLCPGKYVSQIVEEMK